MPILLDTDYEELKACGLEFVEDEPNRFLVLTNYQLPDGLYQDKSGDILVIVPQNYNQNGNDMFWTHPRLFRADGKQIPATNEPGSGDNRVYSGKEFCRWSRHWQNGSAVWKPGKDTVVTILRRIAWALGNPDAQ
jgi:Prokaryotic E2 family E